MMRFEHLEARPQAELDGAPYDLGRSLSGDVVLMYYRVEGGFLLRVPDVADFCIETDGWTVTCTPAPDASPKIVTNQCFNLVRPMILSHLGELVVHASAVSANGRAIAFTGQSQRGKSTLATAFAQAGHAFLSDDGLFLEPDGTGYLAKPNRPFVRLWPDSRAALLGHGDETSGDEQTEKREVDAGPALPFQDTPVPLSAIYILGDRPSESIEMARLKPASALAELIQHSLILDVEDRLRVRALFDRLGTLAEVAPCYRLDYPRRYEALPEVVAAILDHSQQVGPVT